MALLVYLAVTQQSHSREALVALLWPDYDHRSGRSDLSRMLSGLRKTLGAGYLLTGRDNVALNRDADLWIDILHFRQQLEACRKTPELDDDCRQQLISAVELYQADFLAGFTLPGSPDFDDWQMLQTEALRRDLGWALEKLVQVSEARNDWSQAIDYARRWVGLDKLHEPAQRRLIALYAQNGQRAEAHHQYRECVRLLRQELGVEPQPETKKLYEKIRSGASRTPLIAGRFQLRQQDDDLLGKGRTGEVYRGVDTVSGHPVAIKVIWPGILEQHPELLDSFRNEGQALRQLDHPNIVKMIAAVVENGRHYLVMEHVGGGSLQEMLARQGPLPVARLVEIGLGLADALAHAHNLNILHGDLKPGNVLLAEDSTPRLTGFGLARLSAVSQPARPGVVMDTLSYLSPEACRGEKLNPRTDIWSLGVLFVEMLTGDLPFQGDNPAATIASILNQPAPDLRQRYPHIPAQLADLLGHMLVKERSERIPTMRMVGVELEAVQQGRSLTTDRPADVQIPHFDWPETHPESEHPFVARTQELARLDSFLARALAGDGQIVFVTGGAGRGKSSLLAEFARRAQEAHSDLVVAGGNGNTFAGVGDPYLPFREVMGQLTGDIATWRAGGKMSVEQARRLWALLPQSVQAILDHGPQLLDVLVPGGPLLARAARAAPAGASWLDSLQREVARRQDRPGILKQNALFGQFTNVLHRLAQTRPLLITLDDLQWIDEGTLGMLFHLGRRLAGSRILIAGAHRPDELPGERDGEPHPLVQILHEFKRTFGDIIIDLARHDQLEGRAFVEAFLDTEPNRLDAAFRQALFQKTGGHPLFTVELLREMQSQGDLVQDQAGLWFPGQGLDWDRLPARVEAVIARRVERLDDASRAILNVASVEGELFTAEIVARVLSLAEQPLLSNLSEQLSKQHRLVRESGETKAGDRYLSLFQFSHALFQHYVYRQLSTGERRRLHGEVASALAVLHADNLERVVVQLANHYSAAGDWAKAVPCWLWAGELAFQKASLTDAARHYRSALAHWPLDDDNKRADILCKLGECQWILGQHSEAIQSLQASHDLYQSLGEDQGAAAAQRLLGRVYWETGQPDMAGRCFRRALAITELEPESKERAWALAGMSTYQMQVENWDESIRLGEEALALARRLSIDELVIQCLCDLGSALSSKGDWGGLTMEKESLEMALALNRPHDAGRGYLYYGEGLLYLGDYEQARDIFEQAIAYTRRMNVPYITDAAVRMLAEVEWLTGNWQSALSLLEPLIEKAGRGELAGIPKLYLNITQGRIHNDLGQIEKAQDQMRESIATIESSSARVALLGEMLRAEAVLGQTDVVAAIVAQILAWAGKVSYLYPDINMALLYVSSLPGAFGLLDMVDPARTAWEQLQRLNEQYQTPATSACLLEGQGWLALCESESAQGSTYFERAAIGWQALGHPYDQARALTGLGQALTRADNQAGAREALRQAQTLVDTLAAKLEDPVLKASFQMSALVQKIRSGSI